MTLRYKNGKMGYSTIPGVITTLHEEGISCQFEQPVTSTLSFAYLEVSTSQESVHISGRVVWVSETRHECGIKLDRRGSEWQDFLSENSQLGPSLADRRAGPRRKSLVTPDENRRGSDRRYSRSIDDAPEQQEDLRTKTFLRSKSATFTDEMIEDRRHWISKLRNVTLRHIAHFSEDASEFRGKIESPIGVAHVPLGIAGPLKINGEHARGTFFVPMATTEGALITSYSFGSYIATRSGGINVKIVKDELRSDPTFVFKDMYESQKFVTWLGSNFQRIKEIAEKTSHHLRLEKLTPLVNGRRVILSFHFHTGDAMGMNMAYKATHIACKMIREVVHPEEFWLHSNFNSIKKTTAQNFINGYGKSVMAEVTIPKKVLEILNTTPKAMERYFFRTLLGSAQAVLFGISAHFANAMTAIAIACGQDAALVANTHNGTITCEETKSGDLYFSAFLPSVFAATVGGGTGFGTSRECLEILDCYGTGKSNRLAEIIVATALAGEISLMTSIVNGTYIYAHETFGRNRPV